MKSRFFLILSVFILGIISPAKAVIDSVGVEVVDGKKVILHKVDAGETLYSLSKKYNVTTDAITAMNPGSDMGIGVGQVLKIPTNISAESTEVEEVATTESDEEVTTHVVKPGETLYAISTLYPCTLEQIKEWNALTSNAIDVGQKLFVSEPNSDEAITAAAAVSTEEVVEETKVEEEVVEESSTNEEPVEETVMEEVVEESSTSEETIEESIEEETTTETVKEEVTEEVETTEEKTTETEEPAKRTAEGTYVRDNDRPIDIDIQIKTKEQIDKENTARLLQNGADNDSIPSKRTVDMGGYTKNFEKGYAILMPETKNDEHYLARHRELPEGTILQIRNLDNGKNVFVRVVGLLEHDDPKVILSLSTKAETRLQTENTTFLVEISYIP